MTGALIIIVSFGALLAAAELWSRLGSPKPEYTRKLVHLGGGAIGLSLPWLIESPLIVFILTASLSALFVLGEKTGLLQSLHGVERRSRGSEYYPLAIWLVFVIAADHRAFYLAGVLVLAMADAFAALIGSKYGTHRYEVEDEFKSIEGSLVFFVIAFLAIHLPILLLTDLPRAVCVLSALLVAMLVTIFEAISLHGTDNLFVPIAVVFVLAKITTKPVPHIALQNLAFVGIVALVLLLAWKIEWFNAGGALAVTLFVFAAWSLGPRYRWAIPVFIALTALAVVRVFVVRRGERRRLKVRAVTRALIVPFLFLLAANMTSQFDLFYAPYLAACAAVFAFVTWTGGRAASAFILGGCAAMLIVLPMQVATSSAAAVIVVVALMTVANARFADPREWGAPSFLFALLAGGIVLAVQPYLAR
jgi:phytol kinase